jgi:hypothetical protein
VSAVVVPWEVWKQRGDLSIAEQHYNGSKAFVDFLTRHGDPACGGLVRYGLYGDLGNLDCEQDGNFTCLSKACAIPQEQVESWSHLLGISRLIDMANITGRATDTLFYATLLSRLTAAYNKAYYNETTGNYGTSITADVLPLYLDLVAPQNRSSVVHSLAAKMDRSAADYTYHPGMIGTAYLLQTLVAVGRGDLALRYAKSTAKFGRQWMIRQTGRWCEGRVCGSNSHNHQIWSADQGSACVRLQGCHHPCGSLIVSPIQMSGAVVGAAAVAAADAAVSFVRKCHGLMRRLHVTQQCGRRQ